MKRIAPLALLLCLAPLATAADFYVSPRGDDTNPGTKEAPLATLPRARDLVRVQRKAGKLGDGPTRLHIAGGVYRITETFTLGEEDSGTEQSPVIWQASPGENVRLVGGVKLTDWQPVSDAAIRDRLAPEARPHVRQIDLQSAGIKDFGEVKPGTRRAELFVDYREEYFHVAKLDTAAKEVWPVEQGAYGYSKDGRYYFLNVLETHSR